MKVLVLWEGKDSAEVTESVELTPELLCKLGRFMRTYRSRMIKDVVYYVYQNGTLRYL